METLAPPQEESSPILSDEQYRNIYLGKIEEQIMGEYEELGVVTKLGEIPATDEAVEAYWVEFHAADSGDTPKGRLVPSPIYAEDGSKIIGYTMYEEHMDVVEEKQDAVAAIGDRSDELYGASFQATEAMKLDDLVGAQTDDAVDDLGIMTDAEYSDYRATNPQFDPDSTFRLFVFDRDGGVERGKRHLFVKKKKAERIKV